MSRPGPLTSWGNTDFSEVAFPQDIRNCATCHAAAATQASTWYTYPNRAACASCHDDVNFATGENHPAGAQSNDNQCASCHQPVGRDWDASVQGAHTVPSQATQLKGLKAEILSVLNAAPGQMPDGDLPAHRERRDDPRSRSVHVEPEPPDGRLDRPTTRSIPSANGPMRPPSTGAMRPTRSPMRSPRTRRARGPSASRLAARSRSTRTRPTRRPSPRRPSIPSTTFSVDGSAVEARRVVVDDRQLQHVPRPAGAPRRPAAEHAGMCDVPQPERERRRRGGRRTRASPSPSTSSG